MINNTSTDEAHYILGQCTQMLQDKMKQDAEWMHVITSYDPLTLYHLIEKTVLAQTEDQYPFATVYDQEMAFYSFMQEGLSNPQWYERFNTKVDVGEYIGVTRQHKVLLEHVAQETYSLAFANLSIADQQVVRDDAEERYVSYAFMRQSGNQHGNLKQDLQNDFTTGDNRYPKNRQQTYSKTAVAKASKSEGTSFFRRVVGEVVAVGVKGARPVLSIKSSGRTMNATSVRRKVIPHIRAPKVKRATEVARTTTTSRSKVPPKASRSSRKKCGA
jgi:hypothetical protein